MMKTPWIASALLVCFLIAQTTDGRKHRAGKHRLTVEKSSDDRATTREGLEANRVQDKRVDNDAANKDETNSSLSVDHNTEGPARDNDTAGHHHHGHGFHNDTAGHHQHGRFHPRHHGKKHHRGPNGKRHGGKHGPHHKRHPHPHPHKKHHHHHHKSGEDVSDKRNPEILNRNDLPNHAKQIDFKRLLRVAKKKMNRRGGKSQARKQRNDGNGE